MRTALLESRLQAGLTQSQIAQTAGLTRASYCNVEHGYKNPSVTVALRLSRILNKPAEALFADCISPE